MRRFLHRLFSTNKIRKKMILYFFLTTFLMSITSLYTYYNARMFMLKMNTMFMSNVYLNELYSDVSKAEGYLENFLSTKHSDSLREYIRYSNNLRQKTEKIRKEISNIESQLLLKDIANMIDTYLIEADAAVNAKRGRDINEYITRYTEANKIAGYINLYINRLNTKQFEENTARYLVILDRLNLIQLLNIIIIADVVVFNIILILWFTFKITKPIISLSQAADEISKGNFDVEQVVVNAEDEISVMADAFNRMASSIKNYIDEIKGKDDHSKELEVYKGIFEINEMGGYIMTVEFGEEDDSGNIGNKIGLSVKSQSFYPYFRDIIKCRCRCLVGPIMLNRIVIFIPSDFTGDEYFQRLEALSIGDYILDKISEKLDADICIGIGRSYKGLENLSCSYKESLKAIRHAKSKETVHIMDVPVEGKINPAYPLLKEKVLLEKAYIGDASECIQAFEFIFDWLVTEYGNSIQNIKNKLIELMVLLYRLAWDYGAEENEFINRRHYLDEMLEFEELSKLKIWCRERIEYIVRSISSIREKKINSLILKARDYIDKNFKSEITLEDVSREVNVSPHYFSRLFKEETGENFIEYLTSVRIQKAKELLENECISVKEICYQVGYGDPNYFSRIFKKVVGITPTDYKRIIDSNPYKEAVQNK